MQYYIIASFFYLIVMLITFYEPMRKTSWFLPISICCNLFSSMCYFLLIKKLNNKEDILINGIYWDFMLIFIGYLIPLFIFQFKFNTNQIIGLTLVVIGILIIKLFHVPL
jgi:drug/metabolite transporter (DMT)-like permease